MSDLLESSCFAAARKHLAKAREAQHEAMLAALEMYRAGPRGARARKLHQQNDRLRAEQLREAIRIREKIHALRAAVRALEATKDTAPLAH